MEAPTDKWEWDAEAGEVVALGAADKRGGEAEPVDFSDEPVGLLAAAAPDMARALLGLGHVADGLGWHTRECCEAKRGCIVSCQSVAAALKKGGVLP